MDEAKKEEYRKKGFTENPDGTWTPTWEYIEESLQKIHAGDQEYLDSLVTMRRDDATGNWVRVDRD